MRKDFFIFLLVVVCCVLVSHPVLAYDDKTTHPALTGEIVDFYNLLHPDRSISATEKEWIISGSTEEDTPPRWLNHFYDPVRREGWTGEHQGILTPEEARTGSLVAFVPTGLSPLPATEWVHNTTVQSRYDRYGGDWTWDIGLIYYGGGELKEAYMALGHVLHLLEDMAVPEHTRNDSHAPLFSDGGSPFEDYARKWTPFTIKELKIAKGLKGRNVASPSFSILEDYLSVVAEYSNKYFFSKDTINDSKYEFPKIVHEDGNFGYVIDEENIEFPVVRVGIEPKKGSYNFEKVYSLLNKVEYHPIFDAYFSRLAPKAVLHGAGVIELFLKQAEDKKVAMEFPTRIIRYDFSFLDFPSISLVGEFYKLKNQIGSFFSNTAANIRNFFNGTYRTDRTDRTDRSQLDIEETSVQENIPLAQLPEDSGTETPDLSTVQYQLDNIADLVDDLESRISNTRKVNEVKKPDVVQTNAVQATSTTVKPITVAMSSSGGGGGGGTVQTPRTFPKVLINEIQLASVSSTHDEFVELYNPNSDAVDLSDWYLQKKTASGSSFSTFAPATLFVSKIIPAGGYFLIAHPSSTFPADVFTTYGVADNNTVVLKNPDGGIVDKAGWGSANDCEGVGATNPADDESIQRKFLAGAFSDIDSNAADFELQSCPSPKAQTRNCGTVGDVASSTDPVASSTEPTTSPSTHILISEIMAGMGGGADAEWVELYNPTNEAVLLVGWSLKRKATLTATTTSNLLSAASFTGTIAPKSFFLIASRNWNGGKDADLRYSQSSNHLAQSEDVLLLYDAEGNTVDEVSYSHLEFDESLERKALVGSRCASPQGSNEFSGNGCDTDETNDFVERAVPNPQNESSLPEPRTTPTAPMMLETASSMAAYDPTSLTVSFAWQLSADYAGSTSSVRYEIYDVSDVTSSTLITATAFAEYSYQIHEVGRHYTYVLLALDRDGLGSATTSATVVVPNFLDDLYFYRDPRASSTDYFAELYYPAYPFIPDRYTPGDMWHQLVFYLNRPALGDVDFHLRDSEGIPSGLADGIVSVKFKDCSGQLNETNMRPVLPDIETRCVSTGQTNDDISFSLLEDPHLQFTLAFPADETPVFTPSDYLTVAFYDYSTPFWAASGRMFSLVATDRTRYYFRDTPPPHAPPVMHSDASIEFSTSSSNIVVRWDAATDPDTLNNVLTYEINFTPSATSTSLDDARWESASPQPRVELDGSVSYHYPRLATPGDSFLVGVRAKDEFDNLSNIVTSSISIAEPPPVESEGTEQRISSSIPVRGSSNPAQTLGKGLEGTLESLEIKYESSVGPCFYSFWIMEYNAPPTSFRGPEYVSETNLGQKRCTSKDGDIWLASDFLVPVVFNPDHYYMLFFYQLERKMLGADTDVYAGGEYYPSGSNFTPDEVVKDIFFKLKGIFPVPPSGG